MGSEFVRSSEFVGLALILILLALVGAAAAVVLRNRTIGRGTTAYLVAVQHNGRSRLGQALVSTTDVRWFLMRSVSLRPSCVWPRGEIELGPPRPLPGGASAHLMDPVRVSCRIGERNFDIVMNNVDYAALRSWSESSPPGVRADVA